MDGHTREGLTEVIQQIMTYGKKISSSVYLRGYNLVYEHCTATNPNYEILGREVYDLLREQLRAILVERFPVGEICGSLPKFNATYKDLSESLSVLSHVFKYLSRHFIKIKRDLSDPSVLEIKSLGLTSFYNNVLYRGEKLIKKALLAELAKPHRSKISVYKSAIHAYKQILIYSGNPKNYAAFLTDYLQLCKNDLPVPNSQASDFCKHLKKRLYLTRKIFDGVYSARISKNLILSVKSQKNELISYFLTQITLKRCDSLIYDVVSMLDAKECFTRKFLALLKAEIHSICYLYPSKQEAFRKGLEFLFNFYNKLNVKFQNDQILTVAFSEALDKFPLPDLEANITDQLDMLVTFRDTERTLFIALLINNLPLLSNFTELHITKLQKRLVFLKTSTDAEEEFLNALDADKYHDLIFQANRCLRDLKRVLLISDIHGEIRYSYFPLSHLVISSDYRITRKPFTAPSQLNIYQCTRNEVFEVKNSCNLVIAPPFSDVNISGVLALLSKQFWNISPGPKFNLAFELKEIETFLLANKRSAKFHENISFDYSLSRAVFSINGKTIVASTLAYTVISALDEDTNLTRADLEKIIGIDLENPLENLTRCGIIILESGYFHINYDYNGNDIDIFDYDIFYHEKAQKPDNNLFDTETSSAIKCQIMKILKRCKKCGVSDLKTQLNLESEALDKLIHDLEKNEFIKLRNDNIYYIP